MPRSPLMISAAQSRQFAPRPAHTKPQTLAPGQSQGLAPGEEGVEEWWGCDATRVELGGGLLNSLLLHPAVIPWERLYRRLPEEAMFLPGVSPAAPAVIELGAFTVPTTFSLLIFDFRPDIYVFSGIDPGDSVPIEPRRFSSIMGFDLTINQQHYSNIQFQIDPIAVQTAAFQAFSDKPQAPGTSVPGSAALLGPTAPVAPPPVSVFNIAAASSFANAAGAGLSMLPQRPTRYGALNAPFTLYVKPGQTVQSRCIVFRTLPSPIAFLEMDLMGFLVPDQWLQDMLRCVKPVMDQMYPK